MVEVNWGNPPKSRLAGKTEQSYSIPFSANTSNAQSLSFPIEKAGARKLLTFCQSNSLFLAQQCVYLLQIPV